MAKSKTIKVENLDILLYTQNNADYISLTDMARYRDVERTNYIIQNWLRTRNAMEFCGLWEQINNPGFKGLEFDAFKREAGSMQLNRMAIIQMKSLLQANTLKNLK